MLIIAKIPKMILIWNIDVYILQSLLILGLFVDIC